MSIFSTQHLDLFILFTILIYMMNFGHTVAHFFSAYFCMREGDSPLPSLTSSISLPVRVRTDGDSGEADPTENNTIGSRLLAYPFIVLLSLMEQLHRLSHNGINLVVVKERSKLCLLTHQINGSGCVGGIKPHYAVYGGLSAMLGHEILFGD